MADDTKQLPEPPVPADCDVRDLDGFMLNVERLLASELWALSTGEELKAALALWCRAWKQLPAASLPDDDRLLAQFSGAGSRWKKICMVALRGFVKCSDGRLYHKTLAEDAARAYRAKQRRRADREAEAERLRLYRERRAYTVQNGVQNDVRTTERTDDEARTKRIRRDRDGTGTGREEKTTTPREAKNGAVASLSDPPPHADPAGFPPHPGDAAIAELINASTYLAACNFGPKQQTAARLLFDRVGAADMKRLLDLAAQHGADEPWTYAQQIHRTESAKAVAAKRPATRAKEFIRG